jgi:hypothetical protein
MCLVVDGGRGSAIGATAATTLPAILDMHFRILHFDSPPLLHLAAAAPPRYPRLQRFLHRSKMSKMVKNVLGSDESKYVTHNKKYVEKFLRDLYAPAEYDFDVRVRPRCQRLMTKTSVGPLTAEQIKGDRLVFSTPDKKLDPVRCLLGSISMLISSTDFLPARPNNSECCHRRYLRSKAHTFG